VVVEVPFGARLADVLARCGYEPGPVVMGGYHGAWLRADEVRRRLVTRADLVAAGAPLGAGVILPVHPSACPVELTAQVVTYLAGQSALRCGPCLNGLPALAKACADLASGTAGEAVLERIEQLVGLLPGRGACAHPDGTVRLVRSLLRSFPEEVAAHLFGPCSHRARITAGTGGDSARTVNEPTHGGTDGAWEGLAGLPVGAGGGLR
jgi:NADH:ubiquinone oxidoreductase subunit F (NADH-binding)